MLRGSRWLDSAGGGDEADAGSGAPADAEAEAESGVDPSEDVLPSPIAEAEAVVEMAEEDEALEEVAEELELSAEDETTYPGVDADIPPEPSATDA